ncbi:FAD-dependent oxidoreductase [Curtobacterium sp. MCSS17_005]|uniref:FAD-dependent oxidoreductase n=1 Tax=Curtobacterium sp. MCSS17_005 TaxID=2175641 RepID=UPI000DA97773|nr:FAD-dependent oxidoreductase [Curtobacterium sp. MCSS17_005]WIB34393.1 FAD-dependent oxidoreductase [Curtobacterium sp. MCSS17_005]
MEDFVVIGAGLAGAATAMQLAARGHSVTVLERTTPGNHEGSSHGSARIFRYAYPQRLYAELVVRSRFGWDLLEEQSGRSLITPTGSLDHGELRPVQQIAETLDAVGVEHELLSAAQAAERWPHLRFDTDVLWHPAAGVLDAIGTVEAMLDVARSTGRARVLNGWEVRRVERTSTGFRIHGTAGSTVDASRIVVTAGGWLPALIGDLALPSAFVDAFPALQVRQEQAVHFPYREQETESTSADGTATVRDWPTFIYKGTDIQAYGLPGGRDAEHHGQKVAEFNGGKVISSAFTQDGVVDPAARARIVAFAERWLPGVDPTPYAETTCLFTNTPNEDFVFDSVDGVTVVSPCSGHGGKFAPLIGKFAADLALGTGDVPDVFRVSAHTNAKAYTGAGA